MTGYLLKGIAIGFIFGIPIGSVGIMTVRNALNSGFRAGLVTGLGSTAADCIYAAVGAFGLHMISDFLLHHEKTISLVGGAIIIALGISSFRRRAEMQVHSQKSSSIRKFLIAFAIGITNPAVILSFLFAFSQFKIYDITKASDGAMVVLGVFIGTVAWWIILSSTACIINSRSSKVNTAKLNAIFGIVLAVFGAAIIIKSLL